MRVAITAGLVMFTLLVGCTGPAPDTPDAPSALDPAAARAALIASLDAWKQGRVDALPDGEPPIRFIDDDQSSGLSLVDYRLMEPDAPIEPSKDVPVRLSLRNSVGGTVERTTSYQVAPGPPISVLRGD